MSDAPMSRPMSDADLKAVLRERLDSAIGLGEGRLARARRDAMRHYHGEPFGNEVEGRSQVVSRDVAHAVESLMPSLIRVFTSGDEVVRFEPIGPEDEAAAQQATDFVNWIWNRQNEGFRNFYSWFKDALLLRLGVVKIWWEEKVEHGRETYEGLTAAQVALLEIDPEIVIVARGPSRVPPPLALPPAAEAAAVEAAVAVGLIAPPDPVPLEELFDVEVRRTRPVGRVRVAPVPPEEFAIAPDAAGLEERPFCMQRTRRTVSDLVALGYDRAAIQAVASKSSFDAPERRARLDRADAFALMRAPGHDPSLREVTVTEAYLRIDRDGDGIAEYRMILAAGDDCELILEDREVDDNPFAALTPILLPHAFHGVSIADQTMDIQLIKSTLWRQMLDNLYLANNPEKEVVASEVNIDDLLTSRPGGLKRVKQPGMIRVLTTPFTAGASFPMLEYADGVLEGRTGVTRYNQGLDADALNKTATGISLISNAGQQRPELIARVFAETGVKRAFRRILQLVCQHQRQAQAIRLRGKWVNMDPRQWNHRMDLAVTVGLGTGNKDQKLAHLNMIAAKQEQILTTVGVENPLVTLDNYYNTLRRLVEAADLKTPDLYFTDPKERAEEMAAAGINPGAALAGLGGEEAEEDTAPDQAALERARLELDFARLELERQRQVDETELARLKLKLERDSIAAELDLKEAEIAARHGARADRPAAPAEAGEVRETEAGEVGEAIS